PRRSKKEPRFPGSILWQNASLGASRARDVAAGMPYLSGELRNGYHTACLVMLLDLVAETGMPSLLGFPFFGVLSSTFVGRPIFPSCFRNGSGSSSSTLTIVRGAHSPRATRIAAAIGGTPAVYEIACDSTSR